jgi:alpha-methylacyl-CoA racemase
LVDVDGVTHPNVAPRFSRTPGAIGAPVRPAGSDTTAALLDWGVPAAAIETYLADGVVTQT